MRRNMRRDSRSFRPFGVLLLRALPYLLLGKIIALGVLVVQKRGGHPNLIGDIEMDERGCSHVVPIGRASLMKYHYVIFAIYVVKCV